MKSRVLKCAARTALRSVVWETVNDAASWLLPVDPSSHHRRIGQCAGTAFALDTWITVPHPSPRWPCAPGGLWNFYARGPGQIADHLILWASDP